MPLVVVCLLLLASVILTNLKWKKICFRIGLALLILFSNEFIANELMKIWEIPATPFNEVKKPYDWGIVLTGVTKAEMVPNDRVYFKQGADRVVHTVWLYKLGLIKKVLVSGGSSRLLEIDMREADEVKRAMLVMGVPESDILIENQSRNTHESAEAVVQMMQDTVSASQCVLITSAFHLRRSLACFKKEGWELDAFSTDFLTHKRKYTLDVILVPKLESWNIWNHLVKETLGYISYWIVGYI
jgi:uncharacterized SAM-binding protein YcdF (DUF218 family)